MIAEFTQLYLVSKVSQNVIRDIQLKIYKQALNAKIKSLEKRKIGELITRMFNDTDKINNALMISLWELVPQSLTFIGILIYLFIINMRLLLQNNVL